MRAMAGVALAALLLSAARAEGTNEQMARRHFDEGTVHYNLGDYDEAIAAYRRAYALSPAPGLLFNIAQAYRAKKDRPNAIHFYSAYLREAPDGSERDFAQTRVEELRTEEAILEAQRRPGSGLRAVGAVTAGAGLVLVTSGIFFGARAHTDLGDGATDAARADTTRAIVVSSVGAAAIITGGICYALGSRTASVTVTPKTGGGAVSLTLAY